MRWCWLASTRFASTVFFFAAAAWWWASNAGREEREMTFTRSINHCVDSASTRSQRLEDVGWSLKMRFSLCSMNRQKADSVLRLVTQARDDLSWLMSSFFFGYYSRLGWLLSEQWWWIHIAICNSQVFGFDTSQRHYRNTIRMFNWTWKKEEHYLSWKIWIMLEQEIRIPFLSVSVRHENEV